MKEVTDRKRPRVDFPHLEKPSEQETVIMLRRFERTNTSCFILQWRKRSYWTCVSKDISVTLSQSLSHVIRSAVAAKARSFGLFAFLLFSSRHWVKSLSLSVSPSLLVSTIHSVVCSASSHKTKHSKREREKREEELFDRIRCKSKSVNEE